MDNHQLIEQAKAIAVYRELSVVCCVGEVGAAILADSGAIYTGINVEAACGIGFCAEHSAVAQMELAGESHILKVVAVSSDGQVVPPCGRCRELITQLDARNFETEVILGEERSVSMKDLLPEWWWERYQVQYDEDLDRENLEV